MMHIFVKKEKADKYDYSWGRSGGGKIGLNGKKVGIKSKHARISHRMKTLT